MSTYITSVKEKSRIHSLIQDLFDLNESILYMSDQEAIQSLQQNIQGMMQCIITMEQKGISREEIKSIVSPARELYARSPFAKRLQDWPRGYAGDYETIEYICYNQNQVPDHSLAYYIEHLSLHSPIAQQHRNKVKAQAKLILDTIRTKPDARILIIGCGGAFDLRLIQTAIKHTDVYFVLNDMDPNAIAYADSKLIHLKGKYQFVEGNIIRRLQEIKSQGPYDLILLGGVLDYFPEKLMVYTLSHLHPMLSSAGKIFFTNIATGNPYRPWIEYLADWHLIERSKAELLYICSKAGLQNIEMIKDETGLTWKIKFYN